MFRCEQDKDIETFLHEKAMDFEERRLCSVYLILDEDSLDSGKLKIEAYFTLSHKTLAVDLNSMSKTNIKKYGGFVTAKTLHFVLIGQLGKHVTKSERSSVTGAYILDLAFEIIQEASDLIPCKYVLVECGDEQKVQKFYQDNAFKFFQNDGEHNQYCKKI